MWYRGISSLTPLGYQCRDNSRFGNLFKLLLRIRICLGLHRILTAEISPAASSRRSTTVFPHPAVYIAVGTFCRAVTAGSRGQLFGLADMRLALESGLQVDCHR